MSMQHELSAVGVACNHVHVCHVFRSTPIWILKVQDAAPVGHVSKKQKLPAMAGSNIPQCVSLIQLQSLVLPISEVSPAECHAHCLHVFMFRYACHLPVHRYWHLSSHHYALIAWCHHIG
ncbi:TPA: hypothetical protein ACH3X1_011119 [Trebouxia sp. C0004]